MQCSSDERLCRQRPSGHLVLAARYTYLGYSRVWEDYKGFGMHASTSFVILQYICGGRSVRTVTKESEAYQKCHSDQRKRIFLGIIN